MTLGVIWRGWLGVEDVGQHPLGQLAGSSGSRLRLAKADTRMRAPSSSRMLSVTWVAMNSSTSSGMRDRLALGLLAQDGEPGLELGRLDVGDEAPLEPAAQPVLEGGDGAGVAVGGQHDLLVGLVERVEGVEELLLEALLALHELDVVDQQDVARRGSGA